MKHSSLIASFALAASISLLPFPAANAAAGKGGKGYHTQNQLRPSDDSVSYSLPGDESKSIATIVHSGVKAAECSAGRGTQQQQNPLVQIPLPTQVPRAFPAGTRP